jgi:thiol-disulfide isomerase/thioredoxin
MADVTKLDDLATLAGERGTVVVFVANGCPTARSYEERLNALAESIRTRGLNLVAVNSNNASLSPPDTVDEMTRRAASRGFRFPYVKDPDGSLAREFGAVCTPHAFLVDRDRNVVYSGRIDDSRLGDNITSKDLENAIGDMLAGRDVRVPRTEPFGCSIVW